MRPSRKVPALAVLLVLAVLLGGVAMAAPADASEVGGLRGSLELIECPCLELVELDLRSGEVSDCLPYISSLTTEGALLEELRIPFPIDCYSVDPCLDGEGPIAQIEVLDQRQSRLEDCPPDIAFTGVIHVDKVTTPGGSAQAFTFSPSWGGNFMLTDASPAAFSGPLAPGVYSVAEVNLPAGWSLDSAVCSDGSSPAEIHLRALEEVTCTFYNSEEEVLGPNSSLGIVKMTNPGGGEGFGFTTSPNLTGPFTLDDDGSMLFSELEPGAYTVTEDELDGDWSFQNVVCDALDWSAEGQSVTVNLAEGEAALCTFYNIAELPFTGGSSLLMPALFLGLGALFLGAGLALVPAVRREG